MRTRFGIPLLLAAALATASGTIASESDRTGRIAALEAVSAEDGTQFGVGAAVGAVTGALVGSQIGHRSGSTRGTVTGAAVGAAIGHAAAQNRVARNEAQRVTVQMDTGGEVTIVQPVDGRLSPGMNVYVAGSGETARVLPR